MALTEPQVATLLRTLTAPVTKFDCGTLCAPGNGGVPVCCHAPSILPVLYKAELAMLQKRSELWRKHVPTGADAPLQQAARACDVFAVCKGHTHCERTYRGAIAELRLLRIAVALHRGQPAPDLRDPLGAGRLTVASSDAGEQIASAGASRDQPIARTVSR